MTCELDVTDCFGRRVILTHRNWERHLIGEPPCHQHPEVVPYHDRFPEVLGDPDLVIEALNGQYHFFKNGITSGRYQHLAIHLVTRPNRDHEGLASFWLSRLGDVKGTIKWPRES